MGRPAPGVLFAQSFLHHRMGEHVDEVRFAEPVVISACEILESNVSSICSSISLKGVSSPQSFAVEFFIRSGGETRFKRLCPAFVYSPSTSTAIDIQAAVTDYLVLRGCYRAVTLIIYGNPVKDLGKFSAGAGGYALCHDLDLESGNFSKSEDLPEALCNPKERSFRFIQPEVLCLMKRNSDDISAIRQLLQLALAGWYRLLGDKSTAKISKALLLAALSFNAFQDNCAYFGIFDHLQSIQNADTSNEYEKKSKEVILEATEQLQELLEPLPESRDEDNRTKPGEAQGQLMWKIAVEGETVVDFSVMEIIFKWLQVGSQEQPSTLVQSENLLGALAAAQLLCFDREGCFHFVLCGGTKLLLEVLQNDTVDAPGATLLVLKVLDCASQHAFGCEALLEWWQPELSFSAERQDLFVVGGVYATLLRMLLQPQRQSVGSIVTQILYRLRVYELAATFQSIVEDLLEASIQFSSDASSTQDEKEALQKATTTLNKLLKLLDVEDSIEEPCANAAQLLVSDTEELTSKLPPSTTRKFLQRVCCHDMDPVLLSLLQERRFIPSLALLFLAPSIRKNGIMPAIFDFVVAAQDLLLALLGCRSGLVFLSADPAAVSCLVLGLCGMQQDFNEMSSIPLHHVTSLTSLGMLFHPKDVGSLLQTSISVVSVFDRLISTPQGSEASVWALWELVTLCRGETGKQAFLALTQFPEAFGAILEAIHLDIGLEMADLGELRHAASQLALELLHLILTDPGAYAIATWVPRAAAVQRVLQASSKTTEEVFSPHISGIDDKTLLGPRLLELVEAAVVYQEWGAIGLLRYCAALVAGNQHIISGLPSMEGIDSENQMGDPGNLDLPNIPTLFGKGGVVGISPMLVSDATVMQLTIGLRILASDSSNLGVATVLYGEGAMVFLMAILEHGVTSLHTLSDDTFDDEMESDGTLEDLPESGSERLLVKLLLPTLLIVLNLLQKLQPAIDQYRNTRLVDVLLRVNRCISARAIAYATVPPFSWSGGALEICAVRRVLASVLICWPVYGWTPAILPRLLGVDHVGGGALNNSSLPMDPIEACSVLSLLGDMLPVEQPLLCMNETRMQYANKNLAVGNLFGAGTTPEIDWHLHSSYVEKFLRALFPHLEQLADMILHFAPTTCGILQDMVKTLVVRVACRHAGYAGILLRPMIGFIKEHTAMGTVLSHYENCQIEHFLQFVSGLMSHPATKLVLMREGIMDLLQHALDSESSVLQERNLSNDTEVNQSKSTRCKWILRSFLAICEPKIPFHPLSPLNRCVPKYYPRFEECCRMVSTILDLVEVMPFTKEIISLVELFEKIASHKLGRAAFAAVALRLNIGAQVEAMGGEILNDVEKIPTSQAESKESPLDRDASKSKTPLLNLWKRLAVQLEMDKLNDSTLVDIVQRFALVAISLAAAGRSAYGLGALKLLFGLDITDERENETISESLEFIVSVVDTLSYGLESTPASVIADADPSVPLRGAPSPEAYAAVMGMLRLLKKPANFSQLREKVEALVDDSTLRAPAEEEQAKQLPSITRVMPVMSSMCARRCDVDFEKGDEKLQQVGEIPSHTELKDMIIWECCTIIPDRPIVSSASKRRLSLSGDTGSKRHRVDGNIGMAAESSLNTGIGTGSNLRIGSASGTNTGLPNRRDSFRQRKPNTSRPPSMHVDDYVARERGSDAVTTGSGNTIPNSTQRNSSSSGRPPSIHVDEFMARQRERQQSLGAMHSSPSQHLLSSIGADSAISKGVEVSMKLSKHENDRESSFGASAHNSHMVQSNTDQVGNLATTLGLSGSDIPGMPSLSGEDSSKTAQKGGSGPAKTHGDHVSVSMLSSGLGSFVGMNEEFDSLYPGFDFFEKDSLEPNATTDFESPSSKVSEEPQQTLRSIAMRHQKSIASRAKLTEQALTAKGAIGPIGPLPVKSSSTVSLEMRTTVPAVGMTSQSSGGVEKPHLLPSVTPWMSSTHSVSESGATLTKLTEEISSLPYTSSSMQVLVPHPPPASLGMMVLPSPPKEHRIQHMVSLPDPLLQTREHKATPDTAMLPKIATGSVFTPLAGDQRLLSAPLPLEAFENQRSLKSLTMQHSALDRGFSIDVRSDKMIRASLPPAPPPLPPPLPPLPPPSTGWLSVDAHIYRPDHPLPITSVSVPSVSISSVIHATLASTLNQQPSSDRSLGALQSSGALGAANSRLFEDSGPTPRGSVRPPHFPPLPPLSSPPLIQNAVQTSTHMPPPVSTIFPYTGGSMSVESRPAYGASSSAPLPPVERVSSFPFSLPSQNPALQSFSLPAPFIPPVPAGRPTSPYSSFPSTATSPQLQQQQHQLQSPLSVQQLQPQHFQQQNQQQLLQQATQSSLLLSPQQQAPKVDAVQSQFQQQQHQILQPQEKFQLPQMFLQLQQLPQPQQLRSHHHQQPIQQEQLHSQQQQPLEQRPQEPGSSLHSLQQMLASPDAIQELLKDQSKLRQLLEQHPKLISLLQEKLSQSSS